jgi:DNA replication protein DnaC
MQEIRPIQALVSGALTAIRAQQTPPLSVISPIIPASFEANNPSWLGGFQTFGDPQLEAMRDAAIAYHHAVIAGESPHWLSLLGTTWTGKTLLATAIWEEIKRNKPHNPVHCSYTPQLIYWPKLVNQLRSGEWYPYITDMQRWPYLVIDEIGAERDTTGFAADQLSCLLGCRTGRWTVLTGNLMLPAVAQIDARIASRMLRNGSVVVECTAMDYGRRKERA